MEKINVGLAVIARKLFDMAYIQNMLPTLRRTVDSDHGSVEMIGPIFTAEDAEKADSVFNSKGCDLLVILAEPSSERGRLGSGSLGSVQRVIMLAISMRWN